jgi:hypothetical protein
MAQKFKRSRMLVDPKLQFRMLLRMATYLVLLVFLVLHVGFFFEVMLLVAGSDGLQGGLAGAYLGYLDQQKTLLGASLLVSPVLLYDLFKFSHRIAGPLYRCRKMIQEMARGQTVPEFKPREHDLMREFFQDFNALIKEWNARVGSPVNGPATEDVSHLRASSGTNGVGQVEKQRV